ncbi:hypothetical protein ACFLY6_00895 [Candidatus Dependentiae bacterium]
MNSCLTRVKIDPFHQICEILLNRDIHFNIDCLDYYWTIFWDAEDKFLETGSGCTIGSLVDELEILNRLIESGNMPIAEHSAWLGNLLEAVEYCYSEKNKDKSKEGLNKYELKLKDLFKMCTVITETIKKFEGSTVETEFDKYPAVNSNDILCMDKDPRIIERSFVDEWNNLSRLLINKNIMEGKDFGRLGRVIKVVGHVFLM